MTVVAAERAIKGIVTKGTATAVGRSHTGMRGCAVAARTLAVVCVI